LGVPESGWGWSDCSWICGDDGILIDRKVWHNRGDRHSLFWQVSIMAMTSLNISIPKSLNDYEGAKLETMIVEALETEESIEITPQYWQTKRQNIRSRFQGSNS
jgi:hypothetical protein